MAAQSFTVELDEDELRILTELVEMQGKTPEALLQEAVAHGLSMLAQAYSVPPAWEEDLPI